MHFVDAKGILTGSGGHFGMNIYRGCTHGCIYCDSRSVFVKWKFSQKTIENSVTLFWIMRPRLTCLQALFCGHYPQPPNASSRKAGVCCLLPCKGNPSHCVKGFRAINPRTQKQCCGLFHNPLTPLSLPLQWYTTSAQRVISDPYAPTSIRALLPGYPPWTETPRDNTFLFSFWLIRYLQNS